jgi:hypothetical protein
MVMRLLEIVAFRRNSRKANAQMGRIRKKPVPIRRGSARATAHRHLRCADERGRYRKVIAAFDKSG